MARERRSLQDLIRSRQRSGFVGRRGQVIQYAENLALRACLRTGLPGAGRIRMFPGRARRVAEVNVRGPW